MKRKRYGYQIHRTEPQRQSRDEYIHLDIEIHNLEGYSDSRVATFGWLTETVRQFANLDANTLKGKDGNRGWWGMDVKPKNITTIEYLVEFTSIVKRLMKDKGFYYTSPADLIAILDSKRMPRIVYDGRLSQHVLVDDVLPAEWTNWLDEIETQCTVSVMATSEDHAKAELMAEFGKQMANGNSGMYGAQYYADRLAQWLQMGQPVRTTSVGAYPHVMPIILSIDELLTLE